MLDFTTASESETKKVYDEIARELGDDRFFTRKELDVLPKILAPFEQVLSFSSGLMDGNTWLVVLTDQRILFLDKGLIFGLSQTSIELENIVSINGETGLIFGNIRISTAATPHEIRNVWKKTVNPFVNAVRAASSARKRGEQLHSPGTNTQDSNISPPIAEPARDNFNPVDQQQDHTGSADQLRRLERLRNAGSISDQEFERQRAKL